MGPSKKKELPLNLRSVFQNFTRIGTNQEVKEMIMFNFRRRQF